MTHQGKSTEVTNNQPQVLPKLQYNQGLDWYVGEHSTKIGSTYPFSGFPLSSQPDNPSVVEETGRERGGSHRTRTHFWEASNRHLFPGEVISRQNEM